ncbi:hypothetical protein EVAR_66456_1 [Eumeta japonica]|uniref:Uncharacterized protein n=1 Tax=Eumeta variegata TaxID=151549 RepID=A0A4C1ZT94_EUMVA|nr:hypothetical protein EVAR_66456_1 [Eumeta japonica]
MGPGLGTKWGRASVRQRKSRIDSKHNKNHPADKEVNTTPTEENTPLVLFVPPPHLPRVPHCGGSDRADTNSELKLSKLGHFSTSIPPQ